MNLCKSNNCFFGWLLSLFSSGPYIVFSVTEMINMCKNYNYGFGFLIKGSMLKFYLLGCCLWTELPKVLIGNMTLFYCIDESVDGLMELLII